jgi:hypothetical protein
MATTKKKSPASPSKKKAADSGSSYVRLRTVLDALELAALRFYLCKETAEERDQAGEKIESMALDMIGNLRNVHAGACPRGYNNCGGVCVPYPCPSEL